MVPALVVDFNLIQTAAVTASHDVAWAGSPRRLTLAMW